MATAVALDKITFSEFAIGTANPVYTYKNLLPGKTALTVSFKGEIVEDTANPDSPAFAGNDFYTGPIEMNFSAPVSSVSFDAGSFNNLHSTQITIFGRNGAVIARTSNSVDSGGYEHFSFDFGENVISRVRIVPVSAERGGFALDSVETTFRPEIAASELSGQLAADNLISGTQWNGKTVTYSFLKAASDLPAYGADPETFPGSAVFASTHHALSAAQKAVARDAIAEWGGVSKVDLVEVSDTSASGPGMIRLGAAEIGDPSQGFAPSLTGEGGDVWFEPGTTASFYFLRELGTALGLKHPDESGLGKTLPAAKDSIEFSVMSNRGAPGAAASWPLDVADGSLPQSLMMNDIAAIQQLYGANFAYHKGNDVYAFDPGAAKIFRTIWDGGGRDTYDASAYTVGVLLDLRPGAWSILDPDQLADLGGGATARGSLANALLHDGDTRSLIENARGGSGDDSIRGNQAGNLLQGLGGGDTLFGRGGNDKLQGGAGDDTLAGGAGDDNLVGGGGGDDLSGDGGADVLSGGAGNDSLDGGSGDDGLAGGAGDDTLTGGNGDDTLSGDDGADTLQGGLGMDEITGGAGIDVISGGDGNDILDGGGDADQIAGDDGNDAITGDAGNDTLAGADGDDTLDGGDGDDSLDGGDGNDTITGGAGNDTADGGTGNDSLDGGDGNDVLVGAAGADTLTGGLGDDSLNGGIGDDILDGGDGTDSILAGDGNDTVTGGAGDDSLDGGDGTDSLAGGGGNDSLLGGAGSDTLTGGAGTDSLDGGLGDDSLDGGDGDDTLVGGDGTDTLTGGIGTDSLDGGLGNDSLDGGDGDDTLLGGDGTDTLTGGIGSDSLSGGAGADDLHGGEDNDLLDGGSDDDTLFGGQGNDALTGGTGNDSLTGGDGTDTLDGGTGDDVITGGLGADRLTGGSGIDTFTFVNSADTTDTDTDTVLDFEQDVDLFDLSAIDGDSTTPGHQALTFIGPTVFTAPGQITYSVGDIDTFVFVNLDGDPSTAEMEFIISGRFDLTAADFVL